MRFIALSILLLHLSILEASNVLAHEATQSQPNSHPKHILLENFATTSCGFMADSESNIKNIHTTEKDALVLTCFIGSSINMESHPELDICQKREQGYISRKKIHGYSAPMIVTNGKYDTKGTYTNIVNSSISLARSEKNTLYIPIQKTEENLQIALPDSKHIKDNAPLDLWFFAYQQEASIDTATATQNAQNSNSSNPNIDLENMTEEEKHEHLHTLGIHHSHENNATWITFTNVIKKGKKLGLWNGNGETININIDDKQYDGYALIAQESNFGPIKLIAHYENPKAITEGHVKHQSHAHQHSHSKSTHAGSEHINTTHSNTTNNTSDHNKNTDPTNVIHTHTDPDGTKHTHIHPHGSDSHTHTQPLQ